MRRRGPLLILRMGKYLDEDLTEPFPPRQPMTVSELPPEKLRLECPADQVGCETSAELGPVDGIIGQDRALKALKFVVEMKVKGWNVYAAVPPITVNTPLPLICFCI